jgi:hypothetical protein
MIAIALTPCDKYPDIIAENTAYCATLHKSRKQYTLSIDTYNRDGSKNAVYITRHWSRRKVTSPDMALEKANAALARLVAAGEVSA